uniref:Putative DNA binding, helix-turn-helix domain containing protein n=1 Tax=viral metagenome TaxID=1070528 RepID=A0A6M3J857_9ZZZZ
MEIYTTKDVARILGISTRRVRALTRSRKLGRKMGRDYLYQASDIENMRTRKVGRPKTEGSQGI